MAKLQSFEVVYNEYFTKLVRYFTFKFQSKEDAEEVANDVLIKVFKHFEGYDQTKAQYNTWIHKIAHNTMIDYFRSKNATIKGNAMKFQISTDSTIDQELYEVFQVPDKGIKTDSLHDSAIISSNVQKALNGLKDTHKAIAVAFFVDELKLSEIVEKLDLPLGTVKGTINRIREKLQSQLVNEYAMIN